MIRNRILLLVVSVSIVIANNCTEDDFTISSSSSVNNNLSLIYLNTLDANSFNSSVEMFRLEINKYGTCTIDQSLVINVKYNLYVEVDGQRSTIINGSFILSDLSSNIIIISNDLNLADLYVRGAKLESKQLNIEYPENILANIYRTSSIPIGTYIVEFGLASNLFYDYIYIDGPDKIELISPGSNIDYNYAIDVFTLNPVFQWNADHCTNCSTGIRISKYNPEIHSNYYDAIDDISIVPMNSYDAFQNIQGNGLFMYPFSYPPLDYGVDYVWQIEREYYTSLGKIKQVSDVYKFRVLSESISDNQKNILTDIILSIIGDEEFNNIFRSSEGSSDLYPYQSKVILNDQKVDMSELEIIIKQIQSNEIKIKNVRLE